MGGVWSHVYYGLVGDNKEKSGKKKAISINKNHIK
jgi:hypothetical protein